MAGLAHAERLAVGDHDDAVVQKAVEEADCGGVLGQDPSPLGRASATRRRASVGRRRRRRSGTADLIPARRAFPWTRGGRLPPTLRLWRQAPPTTWRLIERLGDEPEQWPWLLGDEDDDDADPLAQAAEVVDLPRQALAADPAPDAQTLTGAIATVPRQLTVGGARLASQATTGPCSLTTQIRTPRHPSGRWTTRSTALTGRR